MCFSSDVLTFNKHRLWKQSDFYKQLISNHLSIEDKNSFKLYPFGCRGVLGHTFLVLSHHGVMKSVWFQEGALSCLQEKLPCSRVSGCPMSPYSLNSSNLALGKEWGRFQRRDTVTLRAMHGAVKSILEPTVQCSHRGFLFTQGLCLAISDVHRARWRQKCLFFYRKTVYFSIKEASQMKIWVWQMDKSCKREFLQHTPTHHGVA